MAKTYNRKSFTKTINGENVTIYCYTTNTRCGFCHHAEMWRGMELLKARVSYWNRTWESFEYETCISRLIDKLPKKQQAAYIATFITQTSDEEHKKAEAFVSAFKTEYDKLPDTTKEALKGTTLHSEDEAKSLLSSMKLMNAMREILFEPTK